MSARLAFSGSTRGGIRIEIFKVVNGRSTLPAACSEGNPSAPMIESAVDHCALLDSIGFTRYCVSLKDSDPAKVIEVNRRFAKERPDVPLHLGVTEAGLPPEGVIKTRIAFEQLIAQGIGLAERRVALQQNGNPPDSHHVEHALDDLELDLTAGLPLLSNAQTMKTPGSPT